MTHFVLEAAVAAKWFLPQDPLRRHALESLRGYAAGEYALSVPDIFFAEFAENLRGAERAGMCPRGVARVATAILLRLGLRTTRTGDLLRKACTIAEAFGQSVHVSLYAALAIETGAMFLTADERLVRAMSPLAPVVWVGTVY